MLDYTTQPQKRSSFRALPYLLGLLLAAITGALLWRGWSFYRLGLEARVEHADYRSLRPSGLIGHGLGFIGAALVVTNLLYLARRRLASFRFGSMRAWLDLHTFTGLLAAVFVAFHSAFQLRTPIATVTTVSMGVVVLTGLVGRFLVALVGGDGERPLAAAAAELDAVEPGAGMRALAAADSLPPPALPANASLLRCLAALPASRRVGRARRRAVMEATRSAGVPRLSRRAGRAAAAEARAATAASLLRSWRSLHRLSALLMLLTVGVHIGVAWHYGYRWIFE